MKILMVAAENDALPGGKVGGIGDVVRDIPAALAQIDHQVDVVIPGYQAFSRLPGSRFISSLSVSFGGVQQTVELYQVPSKTSQTNVTQWVLEHPLFGIGGPGKIYCDDPSNRPFATDASKFALFSSAVAKAIISGCFGHIDNLHLHDWHTAMVAVLRAYDPQYQQLKSIHTVYTIHNLALQGIRPLADDGSSLLSWFPGLMFDHHALGDRRF
ncbi:MAG: starch synthase, partial [Alteromonadaceae bacterium]